MKFAIIAAGEGSRLLQEGMNVHKPLVKLCGETLLDRLLRIFIQQKASEIILIVNEKMADVVAYTKRLQTEWKYGNCPLRVVVKSTPSSMHSFFEISSYLDDAPFCLTTVDTVFDESEFNAYISSFEQSADDDGLMAVTDFVDDEKPLYVAADNTMRITGFYDDKHDCRLVSGGIYCLKPKVINILRRCVAEGQSRMRNFQRQLIVDGCQLRAFPFTKIMDVDHVKDIISAETFLRSTK